MNSTALAMPSKVLRTFVSARAPRVVFDPANVAHRKEYQQYQKTGKWSGGCQFKLEWPYLTIPAQCERRLLDFYIAHDGEMHK